MSEEPPVPDRDDPEMARFIMRGRQIQDVLQSA
jgi:hypothetical protein